MALNRNSLIPGLLILLVVGAIFAEEPTEAPTSEATDSTADDICGFPPDTGPCENFNLRYFYDPKRDACRQFIYGGCEGNENRFISSQECIAACHGKTHVLQPRPAPLPVTETAVDFSKVDSYLTLVNHSTETSFTFASGYPFIQLKSAVLADFQLRLTKEISFEFRTPEAQGLLLYHTLMNTLTEEAKYELYVILEGGELKVIHVFGADETTLLVGKGLNRDRWHKVDIVLNPERAQLTVRVDDTVQTIALEGLDVKPFYNLKDDVDSILFIGGMNWAQDEIESSYLFEHFVGCLRRFRLRAGSSKEELNDISPLKAVYYEDIVVGCVDKCQSGENECRHGGRCINHYDRITCDCFGTKYEGESCDYDNPTTVTLRGYSYLSYRIYDWRDRAHSEANRVSLLFRSSIGDSILFYAGGTFPHPSHVALTLLANASLYAEIDFGEGPYGVVLGEDLTSGVWHNFTLIHEGPRVDFYLNHRVTSVEVQGSLWHLRIDPHIYIGGDRKPLGPGLKSTNNFVGCLSEVYFNDINILYGLRTNVPQAAHHGILPPEFGRCQDVTVLPITFSFAESEITLNLSNPESQQFRLSVEFKTSGLQAVLAHGPVMGDGIAGFWELRLDKGEAQFAVIPDGENENFVLVLAKVGKKLSDGSWHHVLLEYDQGDVSIGIDFKRHIVISKKVNFTTLNKIVIGTSRVMPNHGFVGCMRDLTLNGYVHDPRVLLNSGEVREVSLDNCALVDPCQRPNACEHGGQCMVDEGKVVCDCTGTGYTGKNCHFALYKRTCEELALLGYMKSGVYEIDIDGNGPHPPAHVRCQFDLQTGVRKTVVEHDLMRDTEIRSRNLGDLLLPLTYREFTPEMLQSLISQSLQCRQYIRYDCYRAPLELHSYTWFRASSGSLLDYLGSSQPGRCPCSENKTCVQSNVSCNCDTEEDRWNSDEGYLTRPGELGITEIFSLQQRKLHQTGEGRITLGPLECVEANTQQYVVTFKSADAYMEVPGWHRGDLSFSFRTSGEQGILLYQPLLHPKHPYFRVILVNDHELTLEFSINGEPRSVTVKSSRDLNSGEWQQVWIDYNEYHVRFTVNQESILMDLKDGEEFGPFEATLFIGGAPEEMLETNQYGGLIGCFRGLVMNNEVVNLYAYMNARFPDMIQKHCRPSCDPNPCRNGATCVEFWGSYKCQCENPLAHFGQNCETDVNENALTFRTPSAFAEAHVTSASSAAEQGLLAFFNEDILLNIRSFDNKALVFYAYDSLNNFVQLHIEEGKKLVLTFNSANTIYNISVEIESLSSGIPVQILVKREATRTSLHANEFQVTLEVPLVFLTEYNRNPFTNMELEMIKPQRPISKPADFYHVFLGGLDSFMSSSLQGFTGCLRGLKVGSQLVNFGLFSGVEGPGIMLGCNMLCDKQPCENGGVCQENFRLQSYSCDCELTSYSGLVCTEEKGAHFGGDSTIIAKHNAVDLHHVKVQLAFSTTAVRNIAQALLLLQTSKDKTKYLLISLTALGYLRIEEDRGTGLVYGAEVKTINFLNGARHSIYYRRQGDATYLLIDRDEVPLRTLSASIHPEGLADVTDENALHVGGVRNTSDPRFTDYDRFDGCLSNVVVQIDEEEIQPLLVYLGYRRWGSGLDSVTSHDPDGIEEEARCAAFSITPPGVIEQPSVTNNEAQVPDWYPKPPIMLSYRSAFQAPPRFDPSVMNRVLVGLGILFAVFAVAVIFFLMRARRKSHDLLDMEDEQPLLRPSGSFRTPLKSVLKAGNQPRSLADVNAALELGEIPEKKETHSAPQTEPNGAAVAPAIETTPTPVSETGLPGVPEEVEADSEETRVRTSVRKAPLSRISEAYLSDSDEKPSPPTSED